MQTELKASRDQAVRSRRKLPVSISESIANQLGWWRYWGKAMSRAATLMPYSPIEPHRVFELSAKTAPTSTNFNVNTYTAARSNGDSCDVHGMTGGMHLPSRIGKEGCTCSKNFSIKVEPYGATRLSMASSDTACESPIGTVLTTRMKVQSSAHRRIRDAETGTLVIFIQGEELNSAGSNSVVMPICWVDWLKNPGRIMAWLCPGRGTSSGAECVD